MVKLFVSCDRDGGSSKRIIYLRIDDFITVGRTNMSLNILINDINVYIDLVRRLLKELWV